MNRLPLGGIAVGAPGSDARHEAEIKDALLYMFRALIAVEVLLDGTQPERAPEAYKIARNAVDHVRPFLTDSP